MIDPTTSRTRLTHGYRRWITALGTRPNPGYGLRPIAAPSSVPCAPAYVSPWRSVIYRRRSQIAIAPTNASASAAIATPQAMARGPGIAAS